MKCAKEKEVSTLVLLLALLLLQQCRVDVGQHSARREDGVPEEGTQFFVVAHRQLDVARDDPHLLVIFGRVVGQFQKLRHNVVEYGSHIMLTGMDVATSTWDLQPISNHGQSPSVYAPIHHDLHAGGQWLALIGSQWMDGRTIHVGRQIVIGHERHDVDSQYFPRTGVYVSYLRRVGVSER